MIEKKKKIIDDYNIKKIITWLILGFLLTFILESITRASIYETIRFIKDRFSVFLLNYFMILTATSIIFIFKKRRFFYGIISIILGSLYIISMILKKLRGTPLTWADLYSFKDGIAIVGNYVNLKSIIAIIIFLLIIFVISIFLWKVDNKPGKIVNFKSLIIIIPVIFITSFTLIYNKNTENLKIYRWDMPSTYKENGFLYSFLYTASGFKIKEPENYNKEYIQEIKDKMIETNGLAKLSDSKEDNNINIIKPNIIIVQLESFFDPCRLKGVNFKSDPIPNFRYLYNTSTHGYLDVPTFGGGTVRSEFEVLTGLNTDFLAVGEIPNNNILKKEPVESLAYILGDKGYNNTVVHNYEGNFYDRDIIFSNLGFNNYISMEYMDKPKNDLSIYYPEDLLNMDSIKKLLLQNEPQFIYNITVESHGGYDKEYKGEDYIIDGDISLEDKNQIQFYIEKLKGVDKYINELINHIKSIDEPTVVAMFSDHLPSLDILNREDSPIKGKEMYKSEYFIWDNIGLSKEERDIEAYQLGYKILNSIGFRGGIIPTFHDIYVDKDDYQDRFEKLQYDILFGDKYIVDGKNIYSKSDLKLGLDEIKIDNYIIEGENIIINGQNFTNSSKIIINGKILDTEFKDENTLIAANKISNIKSIRVGQIGKYDKVLSESNSIYLK